MAYRNDWTRDQYGNAVHLPARQPNTGRAYDRDRTSAVQSPGPGQQTGATQSQAGPSTHRALSTSSTATQDPTRQQQTQLPMCQLLAPGVMVLHLQIASSPHGYRSTVENLPTSRSMVLMPTSVEAIHLRDRVHGTTRTVYYPAKLWISDLRILLMPAGRPDVVLALGVRDSRREFAILTESLDGMDMQDLIRDFKDDVAFEMGCRPGDVELVLDTIEAFDRLLDIRSDGDRGRREGRREMRRWRALEREGLAPPRGWWNIWRE